MYLTTKSGRKVLLPTAKEEAEINADIAADPDTYELSDADFANMRPASEVLPPALYAGLVALKATRGAQKAPLKTQTTLRLDADILARFKAQGRGWQTRMNDALREWIDTHPV